MQVCVFMLIGIASKTKIWIEWSCLEWLKKAEEQENREWYHYMARDHFAYVGAYRKCIEETDLLKKRDMGHTCGPKHNKRNKDSRNKRTPQPFKDIHPFDQGFAICN